MPSKKPESKKQEPSEDQYKPMGVPEPDPLDRLSAMEAQVKVMRDWINKHNWHHFREDAI